MPRGSDSNGTGSGARAGRRASRRLQEQFPDQQYRSISGSWAEDLFIRLFSEVFGAEKAGYLYSQYPFVDICQKSRFADFLLEVGTHRIAFEIDDDASHNPAQIPREKFYDDLIRQNSMIHYGWDVFRWAVRQLQETPEAVKDDLRLFLGQHPSFRKVEDYLPVQRGKTLDGSQLTLREHQQAALDALEAMRANHETIALLYHATGTGKTVTAVTDARRVGGSTLFLAHTVELVQQAAETFRRLWPDVSVGVYAGNSRERDAFVVCGSIQSVALNLEEFRSDRFRYVIVDEAHHAAAESYRKVLAHFTPDFTLGLTATPERADDRDILEIFRHTAHRMDLQTAVEVGELVPVRCIRIHTNIDLSKVRFNSVQYHFRDLENRIFVPERNQLIVETWLTYAMNRRTVVFCASVRHAREIAERFCARNVAAAAVSGDMSAAGRKDVLARFERGELRVLCACDLLNEGWDCPAIEVLFMARPTMSKVLYVQQLGRGMRLAPGKESLMVFDFVDNTNIFNAPCSLHRLLRIGEYRPGGLVLQRRRGGGEAQRWQDERPDVCLDWPVDALDYEVVDLFDWQHEAEGMLSQMEFVRRVNVQSETIDKYVREGRIVPDLQVPMSGHRTFKYFREESLENYARQFGWTIIDDANRKDIFMDMVERMDMSYSYKPVLLKAILEHADSRGQVRLADIVAYFRAFYEARRAAGLVVEKANCLYARAEYSDSEAQRNILANPFRRFEQMNMLHHTKTLGIVRVDESVWKKLTAEDRQKIGEICEDRLARYYARLVSGEQAGPGSG